MKKYKITPLMEITRSNFTVSQTFARTRTGTLHLAVKRFQNPQSLLPAGAYEFRNSTVRTAEMFSVAPYFVRPGGGGHMKSEILFSFTPRGVQSLISIAPSCDG